MQHQPIGNLMIQANFGRKALDDSALLIANHYRLMVAALVSALLLVHLPLTTAWPVLLLALAIYGAYASFDFAFFPR
jgi:hypothetical protein